MEKFVILPDVTCDISAEIREFFGLTDYVHGYVNIDGREIKVDLDWKSISREEFYKTLMDKKVKVTSASASPEEFYQAFKKYTDQGYAVLSMTLSSKISVTHNIAKQARDRLVQEDPNANVYCLDSLRMSGSFGLLVAYALQLQKQGKSFEEVIAWLEQNKTKVHQMGPIDDLRFIARRGKISTGKAIFGNLVGVKPMGDSNADGYVTVLAKVKGIKKAITATVNYLKQMARDVENQYIFVYHSDRIELANQLKAQVEQAVNCKKVFISDVYPSCGTNIGPGMLSVYFLGEEISADCSLEKQALLDAIANS